MTVRNMFSVSAFDKGMLSRGSCKLKTWIIVYLESKYGFLIFFIVSVKFSFSIKGNKSVY